MTMPDTSLEVLPLLEQLEKSLRHILLERQISRPLLIGIHTGGAWIAEQLHQRLQISEPLGLLDISFYRDDFSQIGMHPQVKPSHLPFKVENRNIVLVDDVLYTGRTVRAALNEIFDYGRPAGVILATLIERNGRQIPIQADCVGKNITLQPGQRITLSGPDPLELRIHHSEK